jgi:hypothetical protein
MEVAATCASLVCGSSLVPLPLAAALPPLLANPIAAATGDAAVMAAAELLPTVSILLLAILVVVVPDDAEGLLTPFA